MQTVPIITKVVTLNTAHGGVYLIQLYVIKVCQRPTTGQWFSLGTPEFPSPKKLDCHDITEILLKVAFTTIALIPIYRYSIYNLYINSGPRSYGHNTFEYNFLLMLHNCQIRTKYVFETMFFFWSTCTNSSTHSNTQEFYDRKA